MPYGAPMRICVKPSRLSLHWICTWLAMFMCAEAAQAYQ